MDSMIFSAIYPIEVDVKDTVRGVLKLKIGAKSINTLVYK
jgi:hypothetical protein